MAFSDELFKLLTTNSNLFWYAPKIPLCSDTLPIALSITLIDFSAFSEVVMSNAHS